MRPFAGSVCILMTTSSSAQYLDAREKSLQQRKQLLTHYMGTNDIALAELYLDKSVKGLQKSL